MKHLEKLLATFFIFSALGLFMEGITFVVEDDSNLGLLFIIGGVLIIYISGKTLIFNPKSMKIIKIKIREMIFIIKYGDEGKIMALKEIYSEKNTQELLERYKQDYNNVRNNVKLVMIEELKKRELITQEEYEDKLNKINEEIEIEEEKNQISFERNYKKIDENLQPQRELENLKTEEFDREEKKEPINQKKTYMEEDKSFMWTSYIIGIFIGLIPISMYYSIDSYEEGWAVGITFLFMMFLWPLLVIIWLFLLNKNAYLAIGIFIPYLVLILWIPFDSKEKQNKREALTNATKEKNHKKAVKLLEKYKNKYNDPDSQGYNSLHYALINRDENLIKLLIENDIYLITKNDLNSYDFFSFSQPTKDIILNDLEILWGGSPNKIIFKEISETKENQNELIEKFYENGMRINIPSGHGNMDLIDYVIYSEVSDEEKILSLNYLIEHGIDINRYNSYDKENILFDLARWKNSIGTDKLLKYAKYLIGKGLNVNTVNNSKENLLHIAFNTRNFEFIGFLIENKGNLEQKNKREQIPLLKIFNGDKITLQDMKSYLNYYYKNNANPFIPDEDDENLINYIEKYNKENKNAKEKSEIEDFKNELIEIMKNRNGD